jgi:hypothetical protein
MMCNLVDASQSHFSNVNRDQHNVGRDQYVASHDQYIAARDQNIHHQTLHFNITDAASGETVQHVLRSLGHVPHQLSSSSAAVILASHHNRSACDVASNLIIEIMRLLDDLTKFSVDYRYLKGLVFEPLHKILFLTGLAIHVCEDTPLGSYLAVSISPEVERCCVILQDNLDSCDRYRRTLYSTPFRELWPQALWSGSKVHELAWKLSACQIALGQFLAALNS